MPFKKDFGDQSEEPNTDLLRIKREQFRFGNAAIDVELSTDDGGKADKVFSLNLSTGDKRISLLELLPEGWTIQFKNIQEMGCSELERILFIPHLRESGKTENLPTSDNLWGEDEEGTRPYLSHPLFLLAFMHEIAHIRDSIPAGRVKEALIAALEGKPEEVGFTAEERSKQELKATELAIKETAKLISDGFDFGDEFSPQAVKEYISGGLSSYRIERGRIDRVVELAQVELFNGE